MKNYENIIEVINDYSECKQNDNWKNYNFPNAFGWMKQMIDFALIDYGQCSEETFVGINLQMRFPDLTMEEIEFFSENEDRLFAVNGKENENYSLKDLLPAYRKLETIRFNILQKEYEDNPDIQNLNFISNGLQIGFENENVFSQAGKISLISDALNSKHPRGVVFKYLYTEEVDEN